MQEYVEERTIAISVKAAKLSGKVLAAACKKVFAEIVKQQEAAKRPKGRQSVRKLMNHHGGKSAMKYVGAPKDFDRMEIWRLRKKRRTRNELYQQPLRKDDERDPPPGPWRR